MQRPIVGALYRKNVIYAVFLYLVLCAVLRRCGRRAARTGCKKQEKKDHFTVCGNDSADHAIVCGNGNSAPCRRGKGSAVEALCVPLQQIARVYTDKGEAAFDSEELQLLDQIMDREQMVTI